MAISLRAKNKDLTEGQKYSYFNSNTSSGVGVSAGIVIVNSSGFTALDFLLLGNFGSETSEIVQIDTGGIDSATHTLTLKTNTLFSHSESTKVTILKYDQVKYYWTALATFDSDTLLDTINVQADSLYTVLSDSDHSTGFGWFKFENSGTTPAKLSAVSNAIPYLNFDNQSIKKVLSSFYSLINGKDRKLISDADALNYLNEAYAIVVSELNLVNSNYNVPADEDISIKSGTKEYDLPDDFSNVISLYNGTDNEEIPFIKLSKVAEWESETSNEVRYYLRGSVLGIVPEPTEAKTYTLKYQKKSDILDSYYSNIDLPDHGEYLLINFMLSRAAIKLQNGKEGMYLELFQNDIQRLKMVSHKRNNGLDSWGISGYANI